MNMAGIEENRTDRRKHVVYTVSYYNKDIGSDKVSTFSTLDKALLYYNEKKFARRRDLKLTKTVSITEKFDLVV